MDITFNVITHDPVFKTFLFTFTQWHIGWQIVYWGGGAGVVIGVVAQRWVKNQGYLGSISSQDSSFTKP